MIRRVFLFLVGVMAGCVMLFALFTNVTASGSQESLPHGEKTYRSGELFACVLDSGVLFVRNYGDSVIRNAVILYTDGSLPERLQEIGDVTIECLRAGEHRLITPESRITHITDICHQKSKGLQTAVPCFTLEYLR